MAMMGSTTEDVHQGLNLIRSGLAPLGLNQNRCLVILEEQNEDCDDDVISEEEDKRLFEGRKWEANEDRSGHGGSRRSSSSADCWMSTYKKLRRASELIGASAIAIDNKIEMAMDLVKSHLTFAVREEMDQMRDQIRGLMERNKQLEEENVILRASATAENFVKIFNSRVHSSPKAQLESSDSPAGQASTASDHSSEWDPPTSPFPLYVGHLPHASMPINLATLRLSSTHPENFSPHFLGHFQFPPSPHFLPRFTNHPQVSSSPSRLASPPPQFLLDGHNVTWSPPPTNYKILVSRTDFRSNQQQEFPSQVQNQQQQQQQQ